VKQRQCWTCNTEHDPDAACPQSSAARSAQAAGGVDPFTSPSEVAPSTIAQYPGECADCGWEIVPGDQIRADQHGDWLHADCHAAVGRTLRREQRKIEREALSAD
jgi:hypothetical protein